MDIILNPEEAANGMNLFPEGLNGVVGVLDLTGITAISGRYSGAGVATPTSLASTMSKLRMKTNVANAFTLSGVRFEVGDKEHIVKSSGEVQRDISPITGNGTAVGTMTPAQGQVELTAWQPGVGPEVNNFRGVAAAPINGANSPYGTYGVMFRTAIAPLRTGSFTLLGKMRDGTTFNVAADANGYINTTRIKGRFNYTAGVAELVGVSPTGAGGQTQSDLSYLGIPGVTTAYIDLIDQESLRYNAVAFSYLPLDSELLGIDPVRLPSDGRVPIYRPGELAVVGHEATTAPANAANGAVISAGRTRLSRLRLLGADNHVINGGYTENLEAGTATVVDNTGWSQPVRMEHRIEDTGLMRDAQIDGRIVFTRPLTHNYPVGSYVSSALRSGDLKARTSLVFDQFSWDKTSFKDTLTGDPAAGTYNTVGYPIAVTNVGAITERWALHFKSNMAFDVIGEHVGVVDSGDINSVTAPLNPLTGKPYFTIPIEGWGGGWASGNVVFIHTIGAMFSFWMIRTTQQGPEAAADYSFLTIVRGDVDNPVS